MARSNYIYVLWQGDGFFDGLIGTFTVKHEMLTYIERHPGTHYYAMRHKDGHPEVPVTRVELP